MSKEYMYIIGVGSSEDWDAGHGSLYFIEDRNGKHAMPVFSTPEGVERHIDANFNRPESHMQMLESIADAPGHAPALSAGRFIIMPVDAGLLVKTALGNGIDYLVRDPRPGELQEVIHLD